MTDKFPGKPKGIEVQYRDNYITIKQNWFDIRNTEMLFHIIFGFIWFTGVFLALIHVIIEGDFIRVLFLIPFLLIGIFWLYDSITKIINKTFITVNNKAIIVRNKPIPTNNFDLRLIKLETIFSQIKTEKSKHPNTNEEKTNYYYQIYAQTSNNTNKKVIETNNREQMLFIKKKTLEEYLNIKDDTQEGEIS